jgi:D-3-phosphoglycerate dehydrogenase
MRILLADKLPDQARVRLAAAGCEVRADSGLTEEALLTLLSTFQPDVLVVRSTKVRIAHLDANPRLSLVVRAGAGVDNIDLSACSQRGIYVSNCPGKNAVAVAELAIGLLLALDRRVPDNVSALRQGQWNKKEFGVARGVKGRTLGILGFGTIGAEVARMATGLGMEVLAWSRSLGVDEAALHAVRRALTPEDLARRSDALSIHLALTPETRGFVGESIFREMKHGALFVNTARAEVVDEDALLRALDTKGIRAGLDVFAGEPSAAQGPFESRLTKHSNVYGTHHIGASTDQAQEAVADEACNLILTYQALGRVPNCVNLATRTSADHTLVVRHRDRVGVLASVLGVLREAGINVEEMENIIFAGGEAACARIQIHGKPSPEVLARISGAEHIFSATVVRIEGGANR